MAQYGGSARSLLPKHAGAGGGGVRGDGREVEAATVAAERRARQAFRHQQLPQQRQSSLRRFCAPCGVGFLEQPQLDAHVAKHVTCAAPGCEFAAMQKIVQAHALAAHGAAQDALSGGAERPAVRARSEKDAQAAAEQHEWFCPPCAVGFDTQLLFDSHVRSHRVCGEPGCGYFGVRKVVGAHVKHAHGHAALLNVCRVRACGFSGSKSSVRWHEETAHDALSMPTVTRLEDLERMAVELALGGGASGTVTREVGGAETAAAVARCEVCDRTFSDTRDLEVHVQAHVRCREPGCGFSASKLVVMEHFEQQHPQRSTKTVKALLDQERRAEKADEHPVPDERPSAAGSRGAVRVPDCDPECDLEGTLGDPFDFDFDIFTPLKRASTKAKEWYCVPCEKSFASDAEAKACTSKHAECLDPDCTFSASKEIVAAHFITVHAQSIRAARRPTTLRSDEVAQSRQQQSPALSQSAYTTPPPVGYVCKLCGSSSHWIYNCSRALKPSIPRSHLNQRQTSMRAQPPGPQRQLQGLAPTAPTASTPTTQQSVAPPLDVTTESWRCEPCGTDFTVAHHLHGHILQHVACPVAGCGFSALKRVVKEHALKVHGHAIPKSAAKAQAGAAVTSADGDDRLNVLVMDGKRYRVQEIEVGGQKCSVLVEVSAAEVAVQQSANRSANGHQRAPAAQDPSADSKASSRSSELIAPPAVGSLSVPPPPAYRCSICRVSGHWSQVCPLRDTTVGKMVLRAQALPRDTVPPPNYVCRACKVPGHWIEDCALSLAKRRGSANQSLSAHHSLQGSTRSARANSVTTQARTVMGDPRVVAQPRQQYPPQPRYAQQPHQQQNSQQFHQQSYLPRQPPQYPPARHQQLPPPASTIFVPMPPPQQVVYVHQPQQQHQTCTSVPPPSYCCAKCRVPGHWIRDCPNVMPPRTYVCHRCGEPGHWVHACPYFAASRHSEPVRAASVISE